MVPVQLVDSCELPASGFRLPALCGLEAGGWKLVACSSHAATRVRPPPHPACGCAAGCVGPRIGARSIADRRPSACLVRRWTSWRWMPTDLQSPTCRRPTSKCESPTASASCARCDASRPHHRPGASSAAARLPPPYGTNDFVAVGRPFLLVIDQESFGAGRELLFRNAVEGLLGQFTPADRAMVGGASVRRSDHGVHLRYRAHPAGRRSRERSRREERNGIRAGVPHAPLPRVVG